MKLKLYFANDLKGVAEFTLEKGGIRVEKIGRETTAFTTFALTVEDLKSSKLFFFEQHIPATPTKVLEGKFFFEINDPDGNIIQIFGA